MGDRRAFDGSNVMTPTLARELGLKLEGAMQGRGAGEKSQDVALTMVDHMDVGGAFMDHQAFASIALESFGDAQQQTCGLWLRAEDFVWIVCRRAQGEAYQPMTFVSSEEAASVAEKLAAVLWPSVNETQEYYFNTQNFS